MPKNSITDIEYVWMSTDSKRGVMQSGDDILLFNFDAGQITSQTSEQYGLKTMFDNGFATHLSDTQMQWHAVEDAAVASTTQFQSDFIPISTST